MLLRLLLVTSTPSTIDTRRFFRQPTYIDWAADPKVGITSCYSTCITDICWAKDYPTSQGLLKRSSFARRSLTKLLVTVLRDPAIRAWTRGPTKRMESWNHVSSQYQKPVLVGVGVTFTILPMVVVGLRFYARHFTRATVGMDDWFILFALVNLHAWMLGWRVGS